MNQAQKLNASKAEVVQPQTTSKPFKQFNSQDEWQDEINRIIGQRLKQKRENQSVEENYFRLCKLVSHYFGTVDIQSLNSIFSNMKRAAMAQDLIHQTEKNKLASGIDEKEKQVSQALSDYAKQSGKSEEELSQNPDFLRYLKELGLNPEDADILANKEDWKKSSLSEAKQAIAASILAKQNRIAENGMQGGRSNKKSKISPKNLTNADIDDILRRVKTGEQISF